MFADLFGFHYLLALLGEAGGDISDGLALVQKHVKNPADGNFSSSTLALTKFRGQATPRRSI